MQVTILPDGREFWHRQFRCDATGKTSRFATVQWCEHDATFTESDGPFRFHFSLVPTATGYDHVLTGFDVALSPWFSTRRHPLTAAETASPSTSQLNLSGPAGADRVRIPVPRVLWPRVHGVTEGHAQGWNYCITIEAPRFFGWSLGQLVAYSGTIDKVVNVPLTPPAGQRHS